jgi:hypothetical protein
MPLSLLGHYAFHAFRFRKIKERFTFALDIIPKLCRSLV